MRATFPQILTTAYTGCSVATMAHSVHMCQQRCRSSPDPPQKTHSIWGAVLHGPMPGPHVRLGLSLWGWGETCGKEQTGQGNAWLVRKMYQTLDAEHAQHTP